MRAARRARTGRAVADGFRPGALDTRPRVREWRERRLEGNAFLLSVACGAVAWLLVANRTGLPVSTTHALTGALCGAGLATANLTTSALVSAASFWALPVSTTHVSSGAIIGIGAESKESSLQWRTVREMFLAWVVTLPAAALVAALAFRLLA